MTTAIAVTSPELVLPPPDRHTPAAHVLGDPGRQPLDEAVERVRALLDQHGYLIALYPASVAPALRQRLHTVRSVLESDRIALVACDLPPLALAVLVRQLRQLSATDVSPGVLAASVRLLAHYIHAGAVLGSVTRLDRVPVPLTAHARSWLPGSRFAVVTAPKPQLVRVGGTPGTPEGPGYVTRLTTAAGQLTSTWVSATLAPRWQVSGVEETALPPESPGWWGTGRLVEFAAAIPDISVLYHLVGSVQRTACHWCGLELIGDRCAFCAAPLPAPGTGRPPHRAPGARTARAQHPARPAHHGAPDPRAEDDEASGPVIPHDTGPSGTAHTSAAVVPQDGAYGPIPPGRR
ncbi:MULTISPECIES: hypothetical protein [Streptomyces]|uniref:hypothetical protein n=1 Tax=Streptomyces TaxID=1883 RepID=UPI0022492702|nr:hypothetical protein [Streptomyces sp. JHD 1]MCX2969154.1 hypothetical protein [Streptomyces sp. JHD 1]